MSRFTKVVAMLVLFSSVGSQCVSAQKPAQLEYERQQREYRQQQERQRQERQRQEQQRQQQIMQDNARRQQEEMNRSIRANTPSSSNRSVPSSEGAPAATEAGSSPSGARAVRETRQTWEKQPPLAPDRNPLLGRWLKKKPANPFPTVEGGDCGLFFGTDQFVEFRPSTIVAVGRDGREQVVA